MPPVELPKYGEVTSFPSGEYEVWFPANPIGQEQETNDRGRQITALILASAGREVSACTAAELQASEAITEANREDFLKGSLEGAEKQGAKLISEKDIPFAGVNSREVMLAMPKLGDDKRARIVIIPMGKTIYMLNAIGTEATLQGTEATAFFGSFRKKG